MNEMFTASTNTGNFSLLSYLKMVYMHLEYFVYKILIILRTRRMARNMFTIVCILLSTTA